MKRELRISPEKESNPIEHHPFTPFLPAGCKVVMCGTFPPNPEKWSMDFFYPNFQNDMWRIFGMIFFNDKEHFYNKEQKRIDKEGIKEMLAANKIGMGETATEVIRTKGNASDKYLEIVKPVDLNKLFTNAPFCKIIATTGEKAATVIADLTGTVVPKMGEKVECEVMLDSGEMKRFLHWRLPSTSRAYPMAFDRKLMYYREMIEFVKGTV